MTELERFTGFVWCYQRGNERRPMTFGADGRILRGAEGLEQRWELTAKGMTIRGLRSAQLQRDDEGYGDQRCRLTPTDERVTPTPTDPWVFDNQFKRDDWTVVIQGPLNPRSLNNLNNYKRFARVIVSHWDSDDRTWLDQYDMSGVEVVRSKLAAAPQLVSTLAGLERCQTRYAIKCRSDEYYSDLSALLNKSLLHPQKFVSNNILFLRRHWHPSDHLFAGDAELLRKAVKINLADGFQQGMDIDYCTETRLALSFLRAKGVEVSVDRHDESFREHFDVVPVSRLGRYVWVTNQRRIRSNADNVNMTACIQWGYSISDLSEL
jgi:hypothetical protein